MGIAMDTDTDMDINTDKDINTDTVKVTYRDTYIHIQKSTLRYCHTKTNRGQN
jgi:hypothetical protein